MHREKRRQVDFSRDRLARFDMESRLGRALSQGREQAAFAGVDFKAEPALAAFIVQIDVASGRDS